MDADANKVRSGPHSMVSGSGSVFNCAFRLFKASLDGFGAPPEGVLGVWCGGGNEGGRRGNAARSDNDWYVVVIAVVAVGPLATGVRYSV